MTLEGELLVFTKTMKSMYQSLQLFLCSHRLPLCFCNPSLPSHTHSSGGFEPFLSQTYFVNARSFVHRPSFRARLEDLEHQMNHQLMPKFHGIHAATDDTSAAIKQIRNDQSSLLGMLEQVKEAMVIQAQDAVQVCYYEQSIYQNRHRRYLRNVKNDKFL